MVARSLLRNARKTECGAKQFSTRLAVRAAPFALVFLLPLAAAFAQSPPPGVDQELRARTTEFLQYFVDGQYRKALPMVAEDTQDEFFNSSKAELKSFKIESIKYNDDFTKATVTLNAVRVWRIQGQEAFPEVPITTAWKIENGKWMWYHDIKNDLWVTPMGPSDLAKIMQKPDGTVTGAPVKIDQATIDAVGQKILQQQSGLDKSEVTLAATKASSETVTFHNGAPGSVSLELSVVPNIPGFTATLDKADVNFGQSTGIHIQYEPAPDRAKDFVPVKEGAVMVIVNPFNQGFPVLVKFADPAK